MIMPYRIDHSSPYRKKKQFPFLPLLGVAILVTVGVLVFLVIKGFADSSNIPEREPVDYLAGASSSPAFIHIPSVPPLSSDSGEPAPEPVPGQPIAESGSVPRSYFDDAVFIGDSRLRGLMLYCNMGDATDYTDIGMSVLTAKTEKYIKGEGGTKITLLDALKKKKFGKVYLKLGLNELSWSDYEVFYEKYAELIGEIKTLQPDADIYVISLLPVDPTNTKGQKNYPILKEKDLAKRLETINGRLLEMTETEGVYYLNVAEIFREEDGNLPSAATTDGIHLTKAYTELWLTYLRTHTVPLKETSEDSISSVAASREPVSAEVSSVPASSAVTSSKATSSATVSKAPATSSSKVYNQLMELATTGSGAPPIPVNGAPIAASGSVSTSYFDDAVFIGDSRVEGLMLYCDVGKATDYSYKGLNVSTATTNKFIKGTGGTKVTVLGALKQKKFGKIYLKFGVNELTWSNKSRFYEGYEDLIVEIKKLQPDAKIYLQSILPVDPTNQSGRNTYWILKEKNINGTIDSMNKKLLEIAKRQEIYYLNVAECLKLESGALPPAATSDGIHLNRSWIEIWLAYLKTHTVPDRIVSEQEPTMTSSN
ncbi:MAG: hypothetical protein E7486_00595 [Ruminococcaceae bacterium]|nr:hypothetical protein [Oscillospiraceae bacterium]